MKISADNNEKCGSRAGRIILTDMLVNRMFNNSGLKIIPQMSEGRNQCMSPLMNRSYQRRIELRGSFSRQGHAFAPHANASRRPPQIYCGVTYGNVPVVPLQTPNDEHIILS